MVRGVLIGGLVALAALAQTPARAPQAPAPNPQVAKPQPGQGQLDSNETLFTVLAAIHAGGYNAEIDSASSHPLRKTVRDHFAKLDLESVAALKRYVRDHKPRDPNAELSQYISWALLSTGPPSFALKTEIGRAHV